MKRLAACKHGFLGKKCCLCNAGSRYVTRTRLRSKKLPYSGLSESEKEVWGLIELGNLKALAEYGDQIWRVNYNNTEFLEVQLNMMEAVSDEQIKGANIFASSNLAILACYSPKPYNKKAMKLLNRFIVIKFGDQYTL